LPRAFTKNFTQKTKLMSQEMNQSQTVESVNEILVELEEEKVEACTE